MKLIENKCTKLQMHTTSAMLAQNSTAIFKIIIHNSKPSVEYYKEKRQTASGIHPSHTYFLFKFPNKITLYRKNIVIIRFRHDTAEKCIYIIQLKRRKRKPKDIVNSYINIYREKEAKLQTFTDGNVEHFKLLRNPSSHIYIYICIDVQVE